MSAAEWASAPLGPRHPGPLRPTLGPPLPQGCLSSWRPPPPPVSCQVFGADALCCLPCCGGCERDSQLPPSLHSSAPGETEPLFCWRNLGRIKNWALVSLLSFRTSCPQGAGIIFCFSTPPEPPGKAPLTLLSTCGTRQALFWGSVHRPLWLSPKALPLTCPSVGTKVTFDLHQPWSYCFQGSGLR